MLGVGLRRALAAILLTATGFAVRAVSQVPPPSLDGLFGTNDLDLAAGDSIALVHAAAAIVALIPRRAFGLFPIVWSALGVVLWAFVSVSAISSPYATLMASSASVAMVLAYACAVWLLLPTFSDDDRTRSTFTSHTVQGFVVTIPVLLVGVIATPAILPPSGLTREQYAFCTSDQTSLFGGQEHVWDIAALYLNGLPPETSIIGPYRDPDWAAACRYAHVLIGLSADESVWCADSAGRPYVEDAVEILGTDDHGASYPGDSASEYTQACRLAYRYLRQPSRAPITPEHEAFALSSSEETFCERVGADVVDAMLSKVGLEPPRPATPVEVAASRALGCRLAFIADTFDRAGA